MRSGSTDTGLGSQQVTACSIDRAGVTLPGLSMAKCLARSYFLVAIAVFVAELGSICQGPDQSATTCRFEAAWIRLEAWSLH